MAFKQNPLRTGSEETINFLNIAHRGARAFAPENTIPAFEKAKSFDCQMVEMDVHMSMDGELVVFHDDQLTRCTNVKSIFPSRNTFYISDFSYDELLMLDAGSWFLEQILLPPSERQYFLQTLTQEEINQFISPKDCEHYASGVVTIPRLQQSLELFRGSDMLINIEIKTIPRMYPGIAKAVVQQVEKMGLENHVLISSFDHEQLAEVRHLSSVIATGVLTSDRLSSPVEYLGLLDADSYNPGCYGKYDSVGFGSVSGKLNTASIESIRSSGKNIIVWTCNNSKHIQELINAQVTGLITDFPNRVNNILMNS
jgi:glycerophosphoryl diester phosphodiesterase